MKRWALAALLLCGGCASAQHTRVVIAYTQPEPPEAVAVEGVNASGRGLPMPSAGVIETAVRLLAPGPEPEPTIVDAFAAACRARLAEMKLRVVAAGSAAARLMRISIRGWDVRNEGAAGAVVFVTADYQLLDDQGTVLWQVEHTRLPVPLNGPNLSRPEVTRVARICTEAALASLPRPSTRP